MYYLRKRIGRAAKRLLGLRTFPPSRYRPIFDEIRTLRAKRIVEVGTNDGFNAVLMARAARAAGVEQVDYYGFDLFEALGESAFLREFSIRTRSKREVEKFLHKSGLARATLISGDTTKTLPAAAKTLGPMDVIFIDGGHSYETVLSDWHAVEPMVTESTSVFFDDYPNFGIKKVVDEIDRTKWEVTIFPHVDRFDIKDPGFGSGVLGVQIARARRKRA